jgi:hypothetical protein
MTAHTRALVTKPLVTAQAKRAAIVPVTRASPTADAGGDWETF